MLSLCSSVCLPFLTGILLGPNLALAEGAAFAFAFDLDRDAQLTSAGVYADDARLVKTLWTLKPLSAGRHSGTWDGRDEYGDPAVGEAFTFKVVANHSVYTNVGIVGNTGQPPNELGHIQHGVMSVATDANGNIYTANGWEEAGHDFKVMTPEGQTAFHARYQIRNGNPNGAPHAIAVDDGHIYCATHGWVSEQWKHKMQIQRFSIVNGDHEPFTSRTLQATAGHIELYEWPERQVPVGTSPQDRELMELPVRALAVHGVSIYATDALGGKVHVFDKGSGDTIGAFDVALPTALAADRGGRLWVGHARHKVSVYTAGGDCLATPITDAGDIRSLDFGPDGRLYLADGKANRVNVYVVDGIKATPSGTFGQPASPGDSMADRYYQLQGAAMDDSGFLVTIQRLPTGGARIARFSPDGTHQWEHAGFMFCDVGNYAFWRPDELISQRFHRFRLGDKGRGEWTYAGTVLDGDPKIVDWQHGVLRHLKLGEREFIYQCYGDGMQIYRRERGLYRLAAMVGGHNPRPDGRFNDKLPSEERSSPSLWTWRDRNGNGRIEQAEVRHDLPAEKTRHVVFGINADARGNLVYCEHNTHAIWELPMTGLDENGIPRYDWTQARELVSQDGGRGKFFPLMAARGDDESLYAFARSETWERPGGKTAGYAWMGGWALLRFNSKHERCWATKLPTVCVGMCPVPGGGVMLGYFEKAYVYHYSRDGLLIGQMEPGVAAGKVTGWMDNTSAVVVNRDSRDGWLDVFCEDSWLNRMLWYRVDDRDIVTLRGSVQCVATPGASRR